VKSEQEMLVQKAHESLGAAELLLNEDYAEFAISRAYYTMFYIAQALLLDRELAFSSHAAVISAFGREFAKTGLIPSEFHRYLIDSMELRHIADYRGEPIGKDEAQTQIERAKQFLELASKMLS